MASANEIFGYHPPAWRPANAREGQRARSQIEQQQSAPPAEQGLTWEDIAALMGGSGGGGGGGGGGGHAAPPPPDWAKMEGLIRQSNMQQIAGLRNVAGGADTAIRNAGTQLDQSLRGIQADTLPQLRAMNQSIGQDYRGAANQNRKMLMSQLADLRRQGASAPDLATLRGESQFGGGQMSSQLADIRGTNNRYTQVFRNDAAARRENASQLTSGSLQDLAAQRSLRENAMQQAMAEKLLDLEMQKATWR